ncbi:MAG: beta-lactamase [Nevskia sp.]|nr:beta-lactamase [Nevskia sp.]
MEQIRNNPAHRRRSHVPGLVLIAALLIATAALPTWSQDKPPAAPPTALAVPAAGSVASAPRMSTEDLSAFFDGELPTLIDNDDIAGAVVAVVKDGQVLFAKGYGYADVKKKQPVSPADTLFRVGSTSKLFTWTAVMQLAEAGRIDLDADVSQYLDFPLPRQFGKPITMRNLMTHTAGFEETIQDMFTFDADHLGTLGAYLAAHVPAQIFQPGTVGAYSNYGAALAGYIVQRVSGEEFNTYVERHILQPLEMRHATFSQPLPAALAPLMSNGYMLASDPARKFEVVRVPPAGSMSVSALDMAHFMIAHLHNGAYGGGQILRPETARLMHTAQYSFDPRLNAMCLGFYEDSRNGQRIIGHGGDTEYFHTDLHLMLDADTGIFLSYNGTGNGRIKSRAPVFRRFVDRYFPYSAPAPKPLASAAADARAVAGSYIGSRRSQTNLMVLGALLDQAQVSPAKDGALLIDALKGLNDRPIRWREVEPGVWQNPNDANSHVVFKRDAGGRWVLASDAPFIEFQRAAWYQSQNFVIALLVFALGTLLLSLLLWPVVALIRHHHGLQRTPGARERHARNWGRAAAALHLVFWTVLLGTLIAATVDAEVFTASWFDPVLRTALLLGALAMLGSIAALRSAFILWRTPALWWWSRVHHTLLALACIASAWLIGYAHLAGLTLHY